MLAAYFDSFTVVRGLLLPCALVTYRPLIAERYLPPDDLPERPPDALPPEPLLEPLLPAMPFASFPGFAGPHGSPVDPIFEGTTETGRNSFGPRRPRSVRRRPTLISTVARRCRCGHAEMAPRTPLPGLGQQVQSRWSFSSYAGCPDVGTDPGGLPKAARVSSFYRLVSLPARIAIAGSPYCLRADDLASRVDDVNLSAPLGRGHP